MNAAEAHAAAAAEGLALVRAENAAGFKHVSRQTGQQTFKAEVRHGGRNNSLGTFATAEEALPAAPPTAPRPSGSRSPPRRRATATISDRMDARWPPAVSRKA